METTDKIPQEPKKRISDFMWTIIGVVGLIVVLLLLKYLMQKFHMV